jgi:hypothetical protein
MACLVLSSHDEGEKPRRRAGGWGMMIRASSVERGTSESRMIKEGRGRVDRIAPPGVATLKDHHAEEPEPPASCERAEATPPSIN